MASKTFILLVVLLGAISVEGFTWITKEPMPTKRSDMTAVVAGDKIIVAGGCDRNQDCSGADYCVCTSVTSKVEAFFPETNSWETLTSMPVPRYRHAAVNVDQKMFVFGGRDVSDNIITQVDVYDLKTKAWLTLANEWYTATSDLTATVVGLNIYAMGGYTLSYQTLNTTFVMTATDRDPIWNELIASPMHYSKGDACSVTNNGLVYVIGGFNDENFCLPLASVEVYNPANNSWVTIAPLDTPRGDLGCGELYGKLHVIGGETKDSPVNCSKYSVAIDHVESFDVVSNSWVEEKSIPTVNFRSASASYKNSFFIFGGQGQSISVGSLYPVQDTVYEYVHDELKSDGNGVNNSTQLTILILLLLSIVHYK